MRARVSTCLANMRQTQTYCTMYSADNEDWFICNAGWIAGSGGYYWQGRLVKDGYYSEDTAFKLDCPVLPGQKTSYPSDSWYYRCYQQTDHWGWNWDNSNDMRRIGWPRYGRNAYFNLTENGTNWGWNRISFVTKDASRIIELADHEPAWYNGINYGCRLPYWLYSTVELATTTHDAKPNIIFADGHGDRKPMNSITMGQIDFVRYNN
jgi:hypothetical protein